jgi:glycosyltransferase involved in cell wall biosynthesis
LFGETVHEIVAESTQYLAEMTEKLFISIITPSLNRANMLVTAIESVLAQNYPHFEHIIMDGVSTDGSLEKLLQFPHLKVISEPDNGMYDALNRGLKLVHGEIIGFLNSDDLYELGVFEKVAAHFDNVAVEAVVGRAEIFREGKDGNFENVMKIAPSDPEHLLEQTVLGNPAINAWFFRRSVFERIGTFSVGYQIVADREFMIRLALAGIFYEKTDQLLYHYLQHAGSLTLGSNETYRKKIVEEHLKMTDCFLRKAGMPEKAKQYLRSMRTRDTLKLAISYFYEREFKNTWTIFREGIKYDWSWPLKFGRILYKRGRKSLKEILYAQS